MIILGIETSCDETGVCLIEVKKPEAKSADQAKAGVVLTVLGNQLYSQIAIHEKYGGVYPMMAKREHAKNLVPLFEKCLREANLLFPLSPDEEGGVEAHSPSLDKEELMIVENFLDREPELFEKLKKLLETIEKPNIDAIAVTNGPGLEPALWVGITFAKALNAVWNIPIIPTNHMEGHIVVATLSPLLDKEGLGAVENQNRISYSIKEIKYPTIALLISGGHTQLVLIRNHLDYEIIGGTKDDAVGEAFDKVARMLSLPYPGGPQISKYADAWKEKNINTQTFKFPRPMINSKDLNFSFSGLKTSVLYTIKKIPELTEEIKQEIAYEFKQAVIEVLISKTREALILTSAQTLIVGGGVIADKNIRRALKELADKFKIDIQIPEISASTDNALMIAVAGYVNIFTGKKSNTDFIANGNLSL